MKKTKSKLIYKFLKILLVIFIFFIIVFSIFYFIKPKANLTQNSNEDKFDFIVKNLVGGGPGKDGIPSIDKPIYLNINEAILKDDQIIFGVNYNGFVVAYPQNILYWHEIVNEEVLGEKISITFCPLTGSVIGYKGYELGVSGELFNSNLVMYDRKTDSRIPQILGFGIEGELKGKKLETFPIQVTTWKEWKKLHPNTLVLSEKTGFNRNYKKNPYPGYDNLLRIWFPLTNEDNRLKTKELVFGIENNGDHTAILIKGFENKYPKGLQVEVGSEKIMVTYNKNLKILETNRTDIKAFSLYWFAWSADFPNTKLII